MRRCTLLSRQSKREFIRIIATLGTKYSKNKRDIKIFKGEKGLRVLEEELSFTSYSEFLIISSNTNPKEIKQREEILEKIKKRLGKIEIKEIYPKKVKSKTKILGLKRKNLPFLALKGTLIVFDYAIYVNHKKKEGFLIENPLVIYLLRTLFKTLWELS